MDPVKERLERISPEILAALPARLVTYYTVFPLEEIDGKLLLLAPSDLKISVREELMVIAGKALDFIYAERRLIEEAIIRYYGIGADVVDVLGGGPRAEELKTFNRFTLIEAAEGDASIIKLVNDLLGDAIQCRASDIHIEPFEDAFSIRYRIDGYLQDAKITKNITPLIPSLVSRIKIMAELDIGEKRLPQDGRIKVRRQGEEIDLRISVLPSSYGEAIVIRILKPLILFELKDAGFGPGAVEILRSMLHKPNGLVLFTGPTGSGKTTSLYACLKELNKRERKIITIEDPVEYKLPGVLQIQVNSKINLTFAQALRSVLRHDPDCIMIGEIRDRETAEMATRAALTGHLVFSTLHTNDAASAPVRLIEMGIEPYLVSASLQGVIAQRLVRRKCDPCEKCMDTGFFGRTVIYEILQIDSRMSQMIARGEDAFGLRQYAAAQGMKTLQECAESMAAYTEAFNG